MTAAGTAYGVEGSMDQAMAMEELRERYARGGVPLEEFRRLMGVLMVTTDPAECEALLAQLPPEPAHDPSGPLARPVRPADSSRTHHITAFFGSVDRRGSLWELGPETQASAVFGEIKLDVRMARLTRGENILRLHALFGSITVVVPQGLRIFVDGTAYFGDVAVPGHSVSGIVTHDAYTLGEDSSGSYLRIEAVATFGAIAVKAR